MVRNLTQILRTSRTSKVGHPCWRTIMSLALASFIPVMGGCSEDPPPGNTTDPCWIGPHGSQTKAAVVFVHGLFGDTIGSWTNANGKTFFELLKSSPGIGDSIDIYAFSFTSKMFADGSLNIREAAIKMHESLQSAGVWKYDSVVFVGHSMGGLVILQELSRYPNLRAKVPLVMLYASPQEGAHIANIGDYVLKNPALKQLLPMDGNDFLEQLDDDWKDIRAEDKPAVRCAYETAKLHSIAMIVPRSSATRFCDGRSVAIGNSDHMSIVKPDRESHDSVIVLTNALQEYLLPKMAEETWETPDFIGEGNSLAFALANVNDRNRTVIYNRSTIKQELSITGESRGIIILPSAMPQRVPPGQHVLDFVVVGEVQREYSLVLKLGSLPERPLLLRISDLEAARTMRDQRLSSVAKSIDDAVASPEGQKRLKQLTESGAFNEVAEMARTALVSQSPDLPESVQWLVAADTLADLRFLAPASAALRRMEQDFPDTASTSSAMFLASVIAGQSGDSKIFLNTPTPQVDWKSIEDIHFTDIRDRDVIHDMAVRVGGIPTLAAESWLLRGELLKAEGDNSGAVRAYRKANTLDSSPLIHLRIEEMSTKLRP